MIKKVSPYRCGSGRQLKPDELARLGRFVDGLDGSDVDEAMTAGRRRVSVSPRTHREVMEILDYLVRLLEGDVAARSVTAECYIAVVPGVEYRVEDGFARRPQNPEVARHLRVVTRCTESVDIVEEFYVESDVFVDLPKDGVGRPCHAVDHLGVGAE